MSTRTDGFGIWNDLGSVIPQYKQWLKFSNTAIGGNSVLQLNYTSPNWQQLNSYLLIRPVYNTAGDTLIGDAKRVYPELDGNIVEFPIPEDLRARFIDFRDFQIKKVARWRRRLGITPDASYTVKLEELWG